MTRDTLINTIETLERAMRLFRWLHLSTQKRQFDDAYLADFNHSAELDWSADSLMELLKEISKAMPKQIASATLAELIQTDKSIRSEVERLVNDFSFFCTTYELDGIERESYSIKVNNLIQPIEGDSEAIMEVKRWTLKVWSDASALVINFETYLEEEKKRNKEKPQQKDDVHYWQISDELKAELDEVISESKRRNIKPRESLRQIREYLEKKGEFLPSYKDFASLFPEVIGRSEYDKVKAESQPIKHEKFE